MPKKSPFSWLTVLFLTAAVLSQGCAEKVAIQKPDKKSEDGDITPDALRDATRRAGGDPAAPKLPPPIPPTKPEPDFVVTSNVLWQELRQNNNTFPGKYEGKLVEVSGLVM